MGSLKEFRSLDIDWTMTPEDAVTMYLEWGNNSWRADRQPVRSKSDYSNYFVVYNWDEKPRVILIRRNSDDAQELWSRELPEALADSFRKSVSNFRGVYPVTGEVKSWLQSQMEN